MTKQKQSLSSPSGLIGTVVAAILASQPLIAAPVLLESGDGVISIDGELVSFEDGFYSVNTSLGNLRVSADLVTCSGEGCPTEVASADARPERRPAPRRDDLVNISGSDAIGSTLMPLLVEGYADSFDGAVQVERNNDVEKILLAIEDGGFGEERTGFRIMSSLSSDAFANLIGRSTEIGMSSERIPQASADILARNGAGDMRSAANEHLLALDNIVVIAHPDNPLDTVSMTQLGDIYAGRISNWSEIGGPNAPIRVVNRMANTSTRTVFEDRVFRDVAPGLPVNQVGAGDFEDVADEVFADETSIAYVPLPFIRGTKPMNIINECGIVMTPDAFSARTEEYNLGRFLYLYTRGDILSPEAADFLDFAKSNDADSVILKAGYIDLGVARQAQDMTGFRATQLRNNSATGLEAQVTGDMLSAMRRHDRLSATFRFQTGSAQLTDRGELNLDRLADYAEDLPAGSRLVFVGFADSVGPFANNLPLSEARAAQVLRAFRDRAGASLDGIQTTSLGFSELAPASCNTTEEGRAINRRVEVWIANES
ncbi:phosphate transport system substrate-binding protein [Yoonia maricola]|uniref:Phosphate transport system substrate-binding protein n=1 Tax=Yoonia maricola TaxID=420999 RepID=A0A2M8WKD2_9RHOB|nr:phosphate ABC transporter substrate-binding/OmpA family protein [Yoonia maricola]PJI91390.1 phosphate transport system substrate-binding protein [Yoonia maricola]